MALVWLLATAGWSQTPQEQAAARQREVVVRQMAAVEGQAGTLARQAASIGKQRSSAAKQPRVEWPAAVVAAGHGVGGAVGRAEWPCAPIPALAINPMIGRAARSQGLAPDLLRAVVQQESAFLPCAVSSAGAMGLMQLMPETAAGLGVSDPFDPEENIAAGSRFLRQMLDRFGGDVGLALGAYNAGPGRVEAAGGIPQIPETKAYVEGILGRLR